MNHQEALEFLMEKEKSRRFDESAQDFMPGGVPKEGWANHPHPLRVDRATEKQLRDVDGQSYTDWHGLETAHIHGPNNSDIVEAVVQEMQERGISPSRPTYNADLLAEILVERTPAIDLIRFTNSGTEAVMHAVRAAKSYRDLEKIGRFRASYHGQADTVRVGSEGQYSPDEEGIPTSVVENTVHLEFNDWEATETVLEAEADDLAGILFAPLMGTKVIPPTDGFLEGLNTWCLENDVPLIVDEVVSYRLSQSGASAALGLNPDLVVLGKSIGGGFPVGAVGGRQEIMRTFDIEYRPGSFLGQSTALPGTRQSGTFSGNNITMTAGRIALQNLTESEIERINNLADTLKREFNSLSNEYDAPFSMNSVGSLFRIYPTEDPVEDVHHYLRVDNNENMSDMMWILYVYLLREGHMLSHHLYGAVNTQMDETDVFGLLEAYENIIGEDDDRR